MLRRALIAAVAVVAAALLLAVPTAGAQSFSATVSPISKELRAEMRGVSWRPGCPVGFAGLRLIEMTHRTPDGGTATGRMIVHRDVAQEVVRIFRTLYRLRYPIERMELIDVHGGDDWESIEANNTSAFNCRKATGSGSWSNHAYGYAIDINPIQNPYVLSGKVYHDASWPFIDRSKRRDPMMILAGDRVVRAFEREGWGWGGYWSNPKDYQHFSVNGR
jgi:hypothetical protein